MRPRLIECVANFSEGRAAAVVDEIARAVSIPGGPAILHRTMDADHHRSVITFAGTPEMVLPAAVRAVARAVDLIDLNRHSGVHPRLGAADVVPLIPVENITLEECAELAHRLGEKIWSTTGVPVYFYEAAAKREDRIRLENVRRGGFEGVRNSLQSSPDRAPDLGGPHLHPTAGAVIVGARKFLIAFNMNLATGDLQIARAVARAVRASSGGLPHVKAMGVPLRSRGLVQVSMNLTDFEQTPLHTVAEAVRAEASKRGAAIAGSEIIGLIPQAAIDAAAGYYLQCAEFLPNAVLERRIRDSLER